MHLAVKIGRPGYRVTKQFDAEARMRSLFFQVEYPEIEEDCKPRYRFMSAFEQRVEVSRGRCVLGMWRHGKGSEVWLMAGSMPRKERVKEDG
jgi:hypothetical protein